MRGKHQFWLHLVLILSLIISTALVVGPVKANPTRVYVDPPSTTNVAPGSPFTVYVRVEDPVDLMGFEFKLKYKTLVLTTTASKVYVGDIFGGSNLQFKKDVNDTLGYVWFGVAKTSTPGVSISGSLARIIFTVDSYGGSCLSLSDTSKHGELYQSDTSLIDSASEPIPHEVEDGHFVNSPVHDIAITSVTPSSTSVVEGQTVDVNVVARNHGNFTESFTVAAYANTTTAIGTQTVTDLAPGSRTPLTFTWDTTGVTPGKYIISANATTVPDEADTTDNTYNMAYDFFEKTYTYVAITVQGYPVAAFNYSPIRPLVDEEVTFNASESTPNGGKINTYQWDFGDGNSTGASASPIANNVYVHHGIYTVTLTVRDSEGLTGITSKPITIYLPDVVALINVTAYPTEVPKPQPVSINVTVTNKGVSSETFNVTVYYDSNTIGTQKVISLGAGATTTLNFTWDTTYVPATITGTNYTISANATEISYELDTTNNRFIDGNVTVYKPPGPTADFTYSPPQPIEGQPVNFNASVSTRDPKTNAPIISWTWDFDDGTNGTGEIVTHPYAKAGSYSVKLNVTDSNGLSDATQKTVTVYRHDVAILSVTPDKTEVTIGETVSIDVTVKNEGDFPKPETFNVTASYDTTNIQTINVPDLAPGATTTLTFTWDTTNMIPGTYTIKAKATIVQGETETNDNEKTFDGTVTLKLSSTISISATPATITIGENTIISGAIVPTREGATVTIRYSLAGGSWSELTTVTTTSFSQYSYVWTPTTVGTYEVKASWPGDTDTKSAESGMQPFTVNKMASTISITVTPPSITVGESTTISGSITPTKPSEDVTISHRKIGTQTWNTLPTVPTNSTSQYSYTWTPTTYGTFELKSSWLGDENTLQDESDVKTLDVKTPPVASFTCTPSAPTVGDTVTFTSTSTDPDGSIVSWNWNLGDGTVDSDEIVTHTYATARNFTINLTVTDNEGLTDTTTQSITITKLSSTISISATPATITIGENTIISGSINPVRVGVPVMIWYRLSEGTSWEILEIVTTDDDSQYSYTWTPETSGTYELKAGWEGDENTVHDDRDISVTVNEAPTGIPFYVILAVVAIIIIAICIAAYFLIRKKP